VFIILPCICFVYFVLSFLFCTILIVAPRAVTHIRSKTNNILCISRNTKSIMDHLATRYRLKEGSVKQPDKYLGANIGKWTLDDGRCVWLMSAKSYINSAVSNVENRLKKDGPYGRILIDRMRTN
jgi:hypothetical protein